MAGPGQTQYIGHEGHAAGGVKDEGKEGGKIRINLSTAYGLVFGQCTNYLQSRLKGQEKWEMMSNEKNLLGLLKIDKSLLHKYGEDTGYHHVAYHTLLCCFMVFLQGDYINSEYK